MRTWVLLIVIFAGVARAEDWHAGVRKTAEMVAESFGAVAEVQIDLGVPVTVNDPELTAQMAPVLRRTAKDNQAIVIKPIMGAEDFSFFANKIPALFIALGVQKEGAKPGKSASNHSPYFYVNDKALPYGVEAMRGLALE